MRKGGEVIHILSLYIFHEIQMFKNSVECCPVADACPILSLRLENEPRPDWHRSIVVLLHLRRVLFTCMHRWGQLITYCGLSIWLVTMSSHSVER